MITMRARDHLPGPLVLRAVAACTVAAAVLGSGLVLPVTAEAKPRTSSGLSGADAEATTELTFVRRSDPARTIVSTADGTWVATFTDGARTVAVAGPSRTFREGSVSATVSHTVWARLLTTPFEGTVDVAWLQEARLDRSPDVLATALEYVAGSPLITNGVGVRISGDASYGPLQSDGTRQEGSDWNDYQQVTHTYGSQVDEPEPDQVGSLDCSGYIRMVLGRRLGIPMTLAPNGADLPRRAVSMASSAPGVITIPNQGKQVTDFRRLLPGDLVLFDAATDDGTDIDHVGLYLGRDDGGRYRFLSSRKSADGPTMGDVRGRSVLDGTGLYATAFRSSRRV